MPVSSAIRRLPRGAVLCLLSLCVGMAAAECRADQADDDYDAAIAHYKKQRWKLAAAGFRGFAKSHARDRRLPFVRLYLGISLENLEQYRDARTVLRAFVRDYPKNRSRPDALYRVAECSYFLNDLKTAEKELRAFLSLNPRHEFGEFALPYLGDVQYRLNKPKDAAATFQLALKRYKTGRMADDAKFGLAKSYAALNQNGKALAQFRELAGQTGSPLAADAQMELGSLLYDSKQFAASAKAFDEFDKRFATHRSRSRARLNAGFAHAANGHHQTAVQRFDAAARDKSLRTTARYWQAVSLRSLKEYPKAVAVLKAELARNSKSPLAAEILFEWANCERLQNKYAAAGRRYLDYVQRWPKKPAADLALYHAGEMALLDNDVKQAQVLVDRFRKEYSTSRLWPYRDMLRARILKAGSDRKDQAKAAALLENVVKSAEGERAKRLARYHLTLTYRLLGDHKKALKTVRPLLKAPETKRDARYYQALLLAGRSELADKQFKNALVTLSRYLKEHKGGEQTVVALAARAQAAYHTGNARTLTADANRLIKSFADDPLAGAAVLQLAETAYRDKRWKTAVKLFGKVIALGKTSRLHAAAQSGLGWSQFEQKDFKAAAETFGRLLKDHSTDALLAPQAAYKQAECAERLKDLTDAAKKYRSAFQSFAPEKPAPAGSDKRGGRHYYTFHAGLNAARVLAKLKQIKPADAAYEELLSKFPEAERLDRRLDEWALLNYNAGRYKRADEIFRRLIKEVPGSPLVDNARYTLAESALNAGKLKEAKKVFAELHASEKSDATVKEVSLYRLIGIAVEQQDWKTAQKLAAGFRKQFTNSRHQWYAAFCEAEARFHQDDLKTAKTLFESLKTETPGSVAGKSPWFPRVWLLSAELAYRQSEYGDVDKTIAEAGKRFAKWPRAYLFDDVQGRSFQRQAKFEQAREAFGRVVSNEKGRRTQTAAKCQFLIAETHLMQDDYEAARKAYFRVDALYAFPEWQAPALYMAGQCEEKLKDFKAAAKTYADLIQRFKDSPYAAKAKPRLASVRKKSKAE
ncbi:MAG: tetratricopeptide repeat protein [Planctomycetaceae bacterium]